MSAVYTRLDDGAWGLKITGDEVCAGEIVEVHKSDGSISHETIGRIISGKDGETICAIHKKEKEEPFYKSFPDRRDQSDRYDNFGRAGESFDNGYRHLGFARWPKKPKRRIVIVPAHGKHLIAPKETPLWEIE
jgi:hypothetical protein